MHYTKQKITALFLGMLILAVTAMAEEPDTSHALGGSVQGLSSRNIFLLDLEHLHNFKMKLPFPAGMRFEVYQGNGGDFTHGGFNRYAWDFGLPENTPVCAVAGGRVVRVKQDSGTGGVETTHFASANTVILDHGHGIFTQYLHLRRASVIVGEGDLVAAGQVIAASGNTGFSSTPHLHFQVQDASGQSVAARFVDVDGDGVPRESRFYTSGNDGKGTSNFAGDSRFPLEAFARNQIILTNTNLPGHLLRSHAQYELAGKVLHPARQVAVFVMAPTGGKALLSKLVPVKEDGSFRTTVDFQSLRDCGVVWSELPTQSNTFSLAITPVEDDGSFWSNFSVPVSVR